MKVDTKELHVLQVTSLLGRAYLGRGGIDVKLQALLFAQVGFWSRCGPFFPNGSVYSTPLYIQTRYLVFAIQRLMVKRLHGL